MNKRQRKKKMKKYLPVIADEVNLYFMTDEEREKALKDYTNFVKKHAYRKKYKNLKGQWLSYIFPMGESTRQVMQEMAQRVRKTTSSNNETSRFSVTQSLEVKRNV